MFVSHLIVKRQFLYGQRCYRVHLSWNIWSQLISGYIWILSVQFLPSYHICKDELVTLKEECQPLENNKLQCSILDGRMSLTIYYIIDWPLFKIPGVVAG